MQTYTVKRDGDVSLVFDGLLLGRASSHRPDARRWFDVAIYRTLGGTYVVAGIGRSDVVGERDRCWAVTCTDPADVMRSLTRRDEDGIEFLTRTARDALDEAAEADLDLRDSCVKRVA